MENEKRNGEMGKKTLKIGKKYEKMGKNMGTNMGKR